MRLTGKVSSEYWSMFLIFSFNSDTLFNVIDFDMVYRLIQSATASLYDLLHHMKLFMNLVAY